MLSPEDYVEACRRYKNMKGNGHGRQRSHALILVTQGYSYRETAKILLVDEETVSRWVRLSQTSGLDGLKNHPQWGGEHGQSPLSEQDVKRLKEILQTEAMPGTVVGSGWTVRAIRDLIQERFGVAYSRSGVRKLLDKMDWSYQRGRKLSIQRRVEEQERFEAETAQILEAVAHRGARVTPLAGDQSQGYLEGTIARRWNPRGQQPLIADGARSKQAENIYGAVHLGTGEEVAPFVIDWQDSDATIQWLEMVLDAYPRGDILLWLDQAPHHTSEEVEDWVEQHPRLQVIYFPAYTPEENPKEPTWKALKEDVSHHRWHATLADLSNAIDGYYQQAQQHVVNFLEQFGYCWSKGRIYPLPQTG